MNVARDSGAVAVHGLSVANVCWFSGAATGCARCQRTVETCQCVPSKAFESNVRCIVLCGWTWMSMTLAMNKMKTENRHDCVRLRDAIFISGQIITMRCRYGIVGAGRLRLRCW